MNKLVIFTEVEIDNEGISSKLLSKVVDYVLSKYFKRINGRLCLEDNDNVCITYSLHYSNESSKIQFKIDVPSNLKNLSDILRQSYTKLRKVLHDLLADGGQDIEIIIFIPQNLLKHRTLKFNKKVFGNLYVITSDSDFYNLINELSKTSISEPR